RKARDRPPLFAALDISVFVLRYAWRVAITKRASVLEDDAHMSPEMLLAAAGLAFCSGRCFWRTEIGKFRVDCVATRGEIPAVSVGLVENDGRTEKIIPGLFPGLSDSIPGISPLFVRFLSRAASSAASQKAVVCWGFVGRGSRI